MKKLNYAIVVLMVLVGCVGCAGKQNATKLEKSPCACDPIKVPGRV